MFIGCIWSTHSPAELPNAIAGDSPVWPLLALTLTIRCCCPVKCWHAAGMSPLLVANTAQRLHWWYTLINTTTLWHKSIACLEWDRHPWREKMKVWAAVQQNVATGISLQMADLPTGQSWGLLLFWTEMRVPHESLYTPGVNSVSTLCSRLVSTKKVIWSCDYFFPWPCWLLPFFSPFIRCNQYHISWYTFKDLFFPHFCL